MGLREWYRFSASHHVTLDTHVGKVSFKNRVTGGQIEKEAKRARGARFLFYDTPIMCLEVCHVERPLHAPPPLADCASRLQVYVAFSRGSP